MPAPHWALFKRQDIPDLNDPTQTYLTRWRIVETPLFAIYLHAIRLPDADRHLHDHPWAFWSFILKGGYTEDRPSDLMDFSKECRRKVSWRRFSLHRMGAEGFHAITSLFASPTWSLLLVGRRKRNWGYWVPGKGWVSHEDYHVERGLPAEAWVERKAA